MEIPVRRTWLLACAVLVCLLVTPAHVVRATTGDIFSGSPCGESWPDPIGTTANQIGLMAGPFDVGLLGDNGCTNPSPAGCNPSPVHAALLRDSYAGSTKLLVWRNTWYDVFDLAVCDRTKLEHPEASGAHPTHNHFCAGHTQLADGRLLIVGQPLGTYRSYPPDACRVGGTCTFVPPYNQDGTWVSVFDPRDDLLVALPDMPGHPKFYPTVITKPSGNVLVTGGQYWECDLNLDCGYDDDPGEVLWNRDWCEYDPTAPPSSAWTTLTHIQNTRLYPWMHYIPHGLFYGGPDLDTPGDCHEQYVLPCSDSYLYDWPGGGVNGTGIGEIIGNYQRIYRAEDRDGGCPVLLSLPPWIPSQQGIYGQYPRSNERVLILTGGEDAAPQNTAEIFQNSDPGGSWSTVSAPMVHARHHPNAVLLPTGDVFVVGGALHQEPDVPILECEMFNHTTNQFTAMADLHNGPGGFGRAYHSSALLLPDGRVFIVGGDTHAADYNPDGDSYEIYYPPYLFTNDGSQIVYKQRPTFGASLAEIYYKTWFNIPMTKQGNGGIAQVVLMRPGSSTHSVDFDQRRVELEWTPISGGIKARAPKDGSLAPPGWYLLYAIDQAGTPSVGLWIELKQAPPPPPPNPPLPIALGPSDPNPFVKTTRIDYRLPTTSKVDLTLVDVSGRHVRTLVATTLAAGEHEVIWDGRDDQGRSVAAGTYFYRLTTDSRTTVQKIVLAR